MCTHVVYLQFWDRWLIWVQMMHGFMTSLWVHDHLTWMRCQNHWRGETGQLALKVLVTTTDAQWEGRGDVGSARYEPALLPPCLTIRVLSYYNCQEIHPLHFLVNFQKVSSLRVDTQTLKACWYFDLCSRLTLLMLWLQNHVNEGSTDAAIHTALAKLMVDRNGDSAVDFLKTNQFYHTGKGYTWLILHCKEEYFI